MAKKLINRADILEDILNNISPNYFPESTLDKNRVSIFGYITETMARSIEDTVVLEQRRAEDYCPELSSSEVRVKQTAKLRNVLVNRATPGVAYAIIGVLKSDILTKGDKVVNEIHFTIDRRSTITNNGISFSLEDDILIRAVKRSTGYVYTANYVGDNAEYESYIQMFEQENDQGEEMITLILQVYQFNYNIQEKAVTDDLEFLYDGISFDYNNKLAGFDVYYKQSYGENWKLLDTRHYLTTEAVGKYIYYNDDESGILTIYNNPTLGINVNATIKVEIKETLGIDGMTSVGELPVTFELYRDSSYNYSGINIIAEMLSDTTGASDGDSLADIKSSLIDAKTSRNNITTEFDIINYINDIDANVQIVKKRNDIQDRTYYMYTLLRFNSEIVPATTKRLEINGPRSSETLGDFDTIHREVDRKIIRANTKFKLNIIEGEKDSDYVTKVQPDEKIDPNGFYVICPYMMLIDRLNIVSYYFTSVDDTIIMHTKSVNDIFPYQVITRGVSIYRNAHSDTDYDTYRFSVSGTLNTSNDSELIDENLQIKDKTKIVSYLIFKYGGSNCAYLPLTMEEYDPTTREFTFIGYMKTNDFITEEDGLEIIDGLYREGTDKKYDSVIDFKDAQFELFFMYKNNETSEYTRSSFYYSLLPSSRSDGYTIMNAYYNKQTNPYNLILELNKISKSPTYISKHEQLEYGFRWNHYSINEVPFIEYEYGKEHIIDLYDEIHRLYLVYTSMLLLTTDFEASLKFIATYGQSKYITVTGGKDENGEEVVRDLANLNPTFYFKVYGVNAPVEDIREFIRVYLRDTYITGNTIFISNICTAVEQKFTTIRSIKYLGVDNFDASYQEFTYNQPTIIDKDGITRYIPEQLNVNDVVIDLDET